MKSEGNSLFNLLGIIMVCLLFLILPSAFAASTETYKFERLWPTLEQPWYFNHPCGIAMDSDNFVYIADTDNNRIQKFTSDGHFITKWGKKGTENGEFDYPYGIAIDADDFVYVTDKKNHRVQKFTSDGQFITSWGSENGNFDPHGIAIDGSGFVYVADVINCCIQKFTTDGGFEAKWGTHGQGDGEFRSPYGIAADRSGFVYVTDVGNERIQKFTPDGQFVTQWEIESDVSFYSGIAVDTSSFVYVTDAAKHCIRKFTSDGQLVGKWGSKGKEDGEFEGPYGLFVDDRGFAYVADTGNNRIQKFTAEGQFMSKWGSRLRGGEFQNPHGIAVDSNDFIYVADSDKHRIQKFKADGQFETKWGGIKGTEAGAFDSPRGIAADGSDFIYVADTWNQRIQKFSSDGTFIKSWGTRGSGDGQFLMPQGIAADTKGFVYVTDVGNNLIQKFTSEGLFEAKWGTEGTGDGEFSSPNGIAVDSSNSVYVADSGNHRIQKFTSGGKFVAKWGSKGIGDGEFDFPCGIAADSSGFVYVAEKDNCRIQKFSSDGVFQARWGEFGSYPGQLNYPGAVAVSSNGSVCVADTENHRVQIFKKIALGSANKAIIVAGGGPYDNDLWEDTQMCANFAYRTLAYQMFTKETICYLTSDRDLDLDSNGEADDVDGDATNTNLENALTDWAKDADNLVLYITNHGGEGTFRMSEEETLPAAELDLWLDSLQSEISGKVLVIYDACYSGSFLKSLTPPDDKERIVISSASADEPAYFLTQGSISFSSYFWTQIFNGTDVRDAFDLARNAMGNLEDYQTALLDGNGNGSGNETEDEASARNVYIGNGTLILGDAPEIGIVSPAQTIRESNSATLYASQVNDNDGIARVWAVVRPPNYQPEESDTPILEFPLFDLAEGGGRYEAVYNGFDTPGTYYLAIYAKDSMGNTSVPKLTSVSVENPMRRRALIIAGGPASDDFWPVTRKSAGLAYDALKFQGYSDDDIYMMSPETFSAGVDGLPTWENLRDALDRWTGSDTQDLVIYMVGRGDSERFKLSENEELLARDLDEKLDALQERMPGILTFIYDACRSGSFVPLFTPPEGKTRIVITGSEKDQAACFSAQSSASFSLYFWQRISGGANVRKAFLGAQDALSGSHIKDQTPLIDDNGNGMGNEKSDSTTAGRHIIGAGIILAADNPMIASVSPEQTLDGERSALIRAENVTTTGKIKHVWAEITPPDELPYSCDTDFRTLYLSLESPGTYAGTYHRFLSQGTYKIAVYAEDTDGNVSMPAGTSVFQTSDVQVEEKKGDMNGDGYVSLGDAVLALKVVASMNASGLIHPSYAASGVDVSGDNRIGIEEVIYVLKEI